MAEYKLVDATQLNNDLTDICDAIRRVSVGNYTEADKFLFPNGIESAIEDVASFQHQAGYNVGYSEGHASGYGQGLYYAARQAQNFGTRTNYTYWRAAENITNLQIPHKMKPTNCAYMFSSSIIDAGASPIDLSQYEEGHIDFSQCTSFTYWLNSSPIAKIGTLDTTACSDLSTLFKNAYSLTTVKKLKLKSNGSQTLGDHFINGVTALANIDEITGYFGKSFSIIGNTSLTVATMRNIINALYDYSSSTPSTKPVVSFGTTNAERLKEAYPNYIQEIQGKGWDTPQV